MTREAAADIIAAAKHCCYLLFIRHATIDIRST
jgi:hypothetical protein